MRATSLAPPRATPRVFVCAACLPSSFVDDCSFHIFLAEFHQCESSAKPVRNQCETPVRNRPRIVNYNKIVFEGGACRRCGTPLHGRCARGGAVRRPAWRRRHFRGGLRVLPCLGRHVRAHSREKVDYVLFLWQHDPIVSRTPPGQVKREEKRGQRRI